jgi:hypothetical protein
VLIAGEQRAQPCSLLVGEQVITGVQGPTGPVERIRGVASVTVQVLLNASPAAVQGVPGQADDVEVSL